MKLALYFVLILVGLTQISFGQQISKKGKTTTTSKNVLVSNLINETKEIYPMDEIKRMVHSVYDKFQKGVEENIEELLTEIGKGLEKDEKIPLEVRQSLINSIKEKLPELKNKTAKKVEKWIFDEVFILPVLFNDSFKEVYETKLTEVELKKLNAFFKTVDGKRYTEKLNYFILASLKKEESESLRTDILKQKFNHTQLGKKFTEIISQDLSAKISEKVDVLVENATDQVEDKVLEMIKTVIFEVIINPQRTKKSETIG